MQTHNITVNAVRLRTNLLRAAICEEGHTMATALVKELVNLLFRNDGLQVKALVKGDRWRHVISK